MSSRFFFSLIVVAVAASPTNAVAEELTVIKCQAKTGEQLVLSHLNTVSEPNNVGVGMLTEVKRVPDHWVFDQVSLRRAVKGATPHRDGKELDKALPEDRLVVTGVNAGAYSWMGEYQPATVTQLLGISTDWNDGRGGIKDNFTLKVAVRQEGFSASAHAHTFSADPLAPRMTSSSLKAPIKIDFDCQYVK